MPLLHPTPTNTLPLLGDATDLAQLRVPLLRMGFRPFFLLAATFAVVAPVVWLFGLRGTLAPGGQLGALGWHVHEMLFGFTLAVVAGFLLTAARAWTGRPTASGARLAGLAGLWVLGRVAMLAVDTVGMPLVAVINVAFLPLLVLVLARPIVASKSYRNAGFLVMLLGLWVAQLGLWLEPLGYWSGGGAWGRVLALDLVVVMMVLVGGRVIPMFTRNATGDERVRKVPWLDRLAIASVALLALSDVVGAPEVATGSLAGCAALFCALRTVYWRTAKSWRIPLLWILHVAYAFIPLGLLTRGLAFAVPDLASLATHLITLGSIGGLTLGMMSRVTLGHTGRELRAPRPVVVAFAVVAVSALVRALGFLAPAAWYFPSVVAAGACFSLAFALYLIGQGHMLFRQRADGRPG